ncbi:MAG: hypothetical protein LJF04_02330 [Gemmatimonadetes bacterium]|nr:hypothetical protein [Gemmatimonadota bacterium]
MRRGHTIAELCAVLLLLTLGLSFLEPTARRLRDRLAVVAAREAVASLVAEARIDAVQRGGAVVTLEAEPWRASLEVAGLTPRHVALERDLGVRVGLSRSRSEAKLRYDALGLGQVASETITFLRGGAEAALVVSAYGRVRRR